MQRSVIHRRAFARFGIEELLQDGVIYNSGNSSSLFPDADGDRAKWDTVYKVCRPVDRVNIDRLIRVGDRLAGLLADKDVFRESNTKLLF